MKSMQPMTVSRHVQSVRSVHRRGTYRKSGFVIGRYGNTIRRTRRRRSTLHSLSRPSFSFVSTRFLLSLSRNVSLSPDHCPPTFSSPKKKSASARISASSSTPKTEYHFASRHGAQPADCVPHETLYLAAFVSPTSEKSCREFTYLLPLPFSVSLFSLSLSFFEKFRDDVGSRKNKGERSIVFSFAIRSRRILWTVWVFLYRISFRTRSFTHSEI